MKSNRDFNVTGRLSAQLRLNPKRWKLKGTAVAGCLFWTAGTGLAFEPQIIDVPIHYETSQDHYVAARYSDSCNFTVEVESDYTSCAPDAWPGSWPGRMWSSQNLRAHSSQVGPLNWSGDPRGHIPSIHFPAGFVSECRLPHAVPGREPPRSTLRFKINATEADVWYAFRYKRAEKVARFRDPDPKWERGSQYIHPESGVQINFGETLKFRNVTRSRTPALSIVGQDQRELKVAAVDIPFAVTPMYAVSQASTSWTADNDSLQIGSSVTVSGSLFKLDSGLGPSVSLGNVSVTMGGLINYTRTRTSGNSLTDTINISLRVDLPNKTFPANVSQTLPEITLANATPEAPCVDGAVVNEATRRGMDAYGLFTDYEEVCDLDNDCMAWNGPICLEWENPAEIELTVENFLELKEQVRASVYFDDLRRALMDEYSEAQREQPELNRSLWEEAVGLAVETLEEKYEPRVDYNLVLGQEPEPGEPFGDDWVDLSIMCADDPMSYQTIRFR